jgi:hypothetical protein
LKILSHTDFFVKRNGFSKGEKMSYFNYHATAKRLICEGKLIGCYFTHRHGNISPALVLLFNDARHPVMPIREHKWDEYIKIIPEDKMI